MHDWFSDNEDYPYKAVAIRRQPKARVAQLDELSTERKRQLLLDHAHQQTQQLDILAQLGSPLTHTVVGTIIERRSSRPEVLFPRLSYIDAFVLYASGPAGLAQAQQVLEPDYSMIPNIEFVLSSSPIRSRLRREGQRRPWPSESGIPDARRRASPVVAFLSAFWIRVAMPTTLSSGKSVLTSDMYLRLTRPLILCDLYKDLMWMVMAHTYAASLLDATLAWPAM